MSNEPTIRELIHDQPSILVSELESQLITTLVYQVLDGVQTVYSALQLAGRIRQASDDGLDIGQFWASLEESEERGEGVSFVGVN